MKPRGAGGQAANEYLMIAGLITAMSLIVLGYTYSPLRFGLVRAAACILGDVCAAAPSGGGGVTPLPLAPGGGTPVPGGGPLPWVDPTVRLCLKRPPPPGCSETGGYFDEGLCILKGNGYQNCKALRKRMNCECGNCDECDGSVTFPIGDQIACVHNDTDQAFDLPEALEMIDDVTRMRFGKEPKIKENDAINQMKKQISDALKGVPDGRPIELIAHSQGALVLSNALWQLKREGKLSAADWERLDVVVMGPAESRFPPDLEQVTWYVSDGDAVPGLSGLGQDISNSESKLGEALGMGSEEAIATQRRIRLGPDNGYPDIPLSDCTGVVSCHSSERYLKFHSDVSKHDGADKPGRTIMVNGILTTFEEWNLGGPTHGCELYARERYGAQS
jgi:hypothetical protein